MEEKGDGEMGKQESASTKEEAIICQRDMDMKKLEETEDCFILDFDPYHPNIHLSNLSIAGEDDDLQVVYQKGQVALKDYPHSRHLCVKFPFDKTPHESFCQLCYCYVCDSPAPCKHWSHPPLGHCDATEQDPQWKLQRKSRVIMI